MIVGRKRVKDGLRNVGRAALVLSFLSMSMSAAVAAPSGFVRTSGSQFLLDGRLFFVTGVNNHYLTFGSREEVVRVLDDAVAMGANTVRTFLQPVIGSLDGSVPTIWDRNRKADAAELGVGGAYLLYWDPHKEGMAVNDGPNGMQRVDFLIAEASKRHLKLVIAFLDFWGYTGGAQQMAAWYGSHDKSTFFFEDPRTKQDYKTWVEHVVRRINPLTGIAYRDDPTIMAWELMNEGNAKPESLRLTWTAEMAAYVKSIDPNHLVGSGYAGVADRMSDLAVPTLDFGTWHGYPLYYKLTVLQFDNMIGEFCRRAVAAKKPVLLEEFGYARSNPDQADAYAMWLNTLGHDPDCAGWLVWVLVSKQDSGRYPPDTHDQFDVHNDGGRLWTVLKDAAAAARVRGESERPDSIQVDSQGAGQ
jgi:mannan endo-1,4-beta-mannosidase